MAEIFKRLRETPATLDQLTDHLGSVLDLESTPRLRHVAQTALDRLADCGLVETELAARPPGDPNGPPPAPEPRFPA